MDYRTYPVSRRDREPLLEFLHRTLREEGCRVIYSSPPTEAPFRITFETGAGERVGIIVYAFLANSKLTRNRPEDEYRFQVKYGTKDGEMHNLWQDPYGLYTTLFLGINPEENFFVSADPVLHNPTRFFISIEFKRGHVEEIARAGWFSWERDRRSRQGEPIEVLVGGTPGSLLRLIRFEREAHGEDQGHRQLLAEKIAASSPELRAPLAPEMDTPGVAPLRLHALACEFEMTESEVLDLIASARRLKMAVRGWVAEEHLVRALRGIRTVTECVRLDEEGGPDVRLQVEGGATLTVECKNVLRQRSAQGLARVDFQRTRASKEDPCSRYYSTEEFDIVAACLHAVTERWEFCYAPTTTLPAHRRCPGKIDNNLVVDERWSPEALSVIQAATAR